MGHYLPDQSEMKLSSSLKGDCGSHIDASDLAWKGPTAGRPQPQKWSVGKLDTPLGVHWWGWPVQGQSAFLRAGQMKRAVFLSAHSVRTEMKSEAEGEFEKMGPLAGSEGSERQLLALVSPS